MNPSPLDLVVATKNQGKLRELTQSLAPFPILLHDLREFPQYDSPEETGDSFAENARIKAVSAARSLSYPAIADDSGLVVPALNGDPGIRSARFAGPEATDTDNLKLLLERLQGSLDRSAYFVCSLCLAAPEGKILWEGSGQCHGTILEAPKGENGFGYDPLFLFPTWRKSFAQVTAEEKARVSHRGEALRSFKRALERGIPEFYVTE